MASLLDGSTNYRSLSLKDLLLAREQYHWHLMNKANVVGTAVGLYLIRKTELPPDRRASTFSAAQTPYRVKGPRTFENSEVRDYSWPCVLVLVKEWVELWQCGDSEGQFHPDQIVPRTLYLTDGRTVPVCVVKVDQSAPDRDRVPDWHWPAGLFGGGMPIIVNVQEQTRRATAGCLVSDGHTTYALTNRHVCGDGSEPIFTMAGGKLQEIGRASGKHLTRLPFDAIYPEFPSRRTYVNLDAGLIELNDLNDWTSQVFGLDRVEELADLNELNITLRLIEAPVVASGAASGRLEGRIKALFYRYRSLGGYDYVSDFLIAPRLLDPDSDPQATPHPQTQPGDSGTVWLLVVNPDAGKPGEDPFVGALHPIAVEWGGQVISGNDSRRYAFALATSLTTISRFLDVELVTDHNTGVMPYWGQVGHYSIATFACDALPAGSKIRTLISANVDRISFAVEGLSSKKIAAALKAARENDTLVPLADVPDVIWKNHVSKVVGGRDTRFGKNHRSTGPEHPTHFADVDKPRASDGKTLRQLCLEDPANVDVNVWRAFYTANGDTEQRSRGLLPFRVWQFFDAMKDFANRGAVDEFVCAAGLLSHYVGDACQPLHGSMLADGFADQPKTIVHHHRDTGEEFEEESHVGAGVHSTYETKMIDRHTPDLLRGIQAVIDAGVPAGAPIADGHAAAVAIIELMERSATLIPPIDIVNTYVDAGDKTTVAVQDALWKAFDKQTMKVMADGAMVLARIWEAAWQAGNGTAIPNSALTPIAENSLIALYTDVTFIESLDLDHIGAVLQGVVHA
jgi:hypothetical protein